MSRSIWKGIYFDSNMLCLDEKDLKFNNRSSTLLQRHMHKTISIYNGKDYFNLKINKQKMKGYKIGEFCFTKKKCVNEKKQKRDLKVKAKNKK